MAYWSMLINVKFSGPLAIRPFPNFHLKSNESISQREALLYGGSPVYGKDDFIDSTLAKVVDKVLNSQSHLQDLDNPQVELHLLRSRLDSCKLNSLLRTVPPSLGSDQFVRFDKRLRRSLGVIIHSSISESAWHQATLPLQVGGLGLKEAVPTSSAAFLWKL